MTQQPALAWGTILAEGVEMWDTNPVFLRDRVFLRDWMKLLFYPKKFALYRWVWKARKRITSADAGVVSILDVGCGTGATVIDLKKLFGRSAEVVGVDVVQLEIDAAREKAKQRGVVAAFAWYDGLHLPFADATYDMLYTSDVLGHVSDVPAWLSELARVVRPGGTLAMFAESALGRHAWIRRSFFRRGLTVDPHAQFHISLYSKDELRQMLSAAGFDIKRMYSVFWPAFFLHPEEFRPALQNDRRFPLLGALNSALCFLKRCTDPVFTALGELYGLLEMYTLGRWIESQGYVILAKKR